MFVKETRDYLLCGSLMDAKQQVWSNIENKNKHTEKQPKKASSNRVGRRAKRGAPVLMRCVLLRSCLHAPAFLFDQNSKTTKMLNVNMPPSLWEAELHTHHQKNPKDHLVLAFSPTHYLPVWEFRLRDLALSVDSEIYVPVKDGRWLFVNPVNKIGGFIALAAIGRRTVISVRLSDVYENDRAWSYNSVRFEPFENRGYLGVNLWFLLDIILRRSVNCRADSNLICSSRYHCVRRALRTYDVRFISKGAHFTRQCCSETCPCA